MSRLFLVRHGNTKLNNAKRFWGNTDVPLSDEGIRQAEKLRDRLATDKINTIYASNLSRARLTAEIIASRHQMKITPCKELGELNFGWIEGLTFEEIKRLHPEFAEILSDWNTRPKFPGGESLDELNNRVQKFTGDGVFLTAWGGWGSGDGQFFLPFGLTVDLWDRVVVADSANYRIQVFAP